MRGRANIGKAFHIVVLVLGLLFSAIALKHVELTLANPIVFQDFNDLPILISSPMNNETYYANNVMFNFNVTKPLEWSTPYLNPYNPRVHLASVSYQLDGTVFGPIIVDSDLSSPFKYSENLTNLKDGVHSLQVTLNGTSQSIDMNHPWFSHDISINESSEIVYFTIDTKQPSISVLSIGNRNYDTPNVPLDFTVDEPVSQISYVLDGTENVTVTGNTTISGLSIGEHSLIVYAIDKGGNVGVSETVYFSVGVPFPTTFVAVAAVSVAVIGVGLLVYFRKRNHLTEKNSVAPNQSAPIARLTYASWVACSVLLLAGFFGFSTIFALT